MCLYSRAIAMTEGAPMAAPAMTDMRRPRVVVVGCGFGGLTLIRHLRHAPVDIVLIDRCNHHVFQPLLYQVATAALSPGEIAEPSRSILRRARNVTVMLDEMIGIDRAHREVLLREGAPLAYDYLVLATGVEYDYFGHDEWAEFAPSLKTLQDATEIRRRLLLAFEHAEISTNPDEQRRDFRNIDPTKAHIILLEAGPHLLPGFHASLSAYAKSALERLHVDVRLKTPAEAIDETGLVAGGARI